LAKESKSFFFIFIRLICTPFFIFKKEEKKREREKREGRKKGEGRAPRKITLESEMRIISKKGSSS
jgi:hypothetical protein